MHARLTYIALRCVALHCPLETEQTTVGYYSSIEPHILAEKHRLMIMYDRDTPAALSRFKMHDFKCFTSIKYIVN